MKNLPSLNTHILMVARLFTNHSALVCALIFALGSPLSACAIAANKTPATNATPITHQVAQETFQEVWQTVQRTDADPAHAGVDWMAVKVQFQPRIDACITNEALREILREMLARLGRSHYGIIEAQTALQIGEREVEPSNHINTSTEVIATDNNSSNNNSNSADSASTSRVKHSGTLGMSLRVIQNRVVVTNVQPGSPAEIAGVTRGWLVLRCNEIDPAANVADHVKAGPMAHYARDAAAQSLDSGTADTAEKWLFLDSLGTEHALTLRREQSTGTPTQIGLLPTFRVRCEDRMLTESELKSLDLPTSLRIAMISFNIWMPVISIQFDEAVDRHRACDGIILDLRGNPGGVGAMAMGFAGHFYDDTDSLGTMRTRESSLEFLVNPRRSTADGRSVQPFAGPLAIVVDPMSASTSEIFAAGLQSLHRAHVVGRTSAGAALPAQMRELPNGDGLLFAFAEFTRPDGTNIEGVGVVPDLASGDSVAAWQGEQDPDVAAAAHWIEASLHPAANQ